MRTMWHRLSGVLAGWITSLDSASNDLHLVGVRSAARETRSKIAGMVSRGGRRKHPLVGGDMVAMEKCRCKICGGQRRSW